MDLDPSETAMDEPMEEEPLEMSEGGGEEGEEGAEKKGEEGEEGSLCLADLETDARIWKEKYYDEDILRGIVQNLHDEWVNPTMQPSNMLNWVNQKFAKDWTSKEFTFEALHHAIKRKVYVLAQLNRLCVINKLYDDDALLKEMMNRILHVIYNAKELVFTGAVLFQRMDPAREINIPNQAEAKDLDYFKDAIESQLQHMFNIAPEKMTSFQNLLLYVLQQLDAFGYRKMEDYCYSQVITDDGHQTHAWEQKLTIQEFIFKYVTKENCHLQWQNLTNPANNAYVVANHLQHSEESEFPELNVNRYLYAFKNGLYNTEQDMFYPFKKKSKWNKMAKEIEEYRSHSDRGEHQWKDYVVTAPQKSDVAVKYFDQPFRFEITPETEEDFNAIQIETPELNAIFETQKFETDTIIWAKIMMGRCLFPVRKFDGWDVIVFFKGVAGSGKSTLAHLLKSFFPPHLIGTLSSNIEQKFGLSAIYKSLLCVCSEVREDFGLDQGDWQSCASGEEISIAIKNKTAVSHKWNTPMFLAGNEPPNYRNNSGSVDRRMMVFEFNEKVDLTKSDPLLFQKMLENTDLVMRQLVCLYHDAVRLHGKSNIWKKGILPNEVHTFRQNMRKATDPLCAFLTSGKLELGETHFMLLEDFKNTYASWCKANGITLPRWGPAHYLSTFNENSLIIARETRNISGMDQPGTYITGIQLVEE